MPRHPLRDLVSISTTPIERVIPCPLCKWTGRHRRHGVAGGALAVTSRLYGMAGDHIRKEHPEYAKELGIDRK